MIVGSHAAYELYPWGYAAYMDRILTRPVFLYDADCGVCDQGVARIRDVVRPDVDLVPYRDADLDSLGVTERECEQAPILVRPNGTHVAGPAAMAGVLRTGGRRHRAAAAVMSAPGVRHALQAVFPHAYRQRHRLPGGGQNCQVPDRGAAA